MRRFASLLLLLASSCSDSDAPAQKPVTGGATPAPIATPNTARGPAATAGSPEILAPADAFAWLQVESMAFLDELEGRIARLGDAASAPDFDPIALLREDHGVTGSYGLVDRERPFAIAFSLGESEPTPTFILPSSNGQSLASSIVLPEGCATPVARGGYVAISLAPGYEPAETCPLAEDPPDAGVFARVDLEQVFVAFEQDIENGLQAFEMMAAMENESAPADIGPLLQGYASAMRMFVDSAGVLEIGLECATGGETELAFAVTMLEDSALASYDFGKTNDLAELAPYVDSQEAMTVMIGADLSALMEAFQPFLHGMTRMFADPMRAGIDDYLEEYAQSFPLYGDALAVSGGFGNGGLRFAYFFASDDAEELVKAQAGMLESSAAASFGLDVKGPVEMTIGKVPVVRYHVEFSPRYLEKMLGGGDDFDEAELAAAQSSLMGMFGQNGLTYTLAAYETRMAMVVGDEDYARRVVLRLQDGMGSIPPDLRSALLDAEGANPSVVVRFDVSGFVAGMQAMMMAMMGAPAGTGGTPPPVPVTLSGGVEGRVWRFRVATDLEDLGSFFQDMKSF